LRRERVDKLEEAVIARGFYKEQGGGVKKKT